jgi:hypothetical protein
MASANGIDSKRRRTADKGQGGGRRGARQSAARRIDVVQRQAAADAAVAPSPVDAPDVESGDSCRDESRGRAPAAPLTSASASRARVDADALAAGGVPSAHTTTTRKAKRAATGTSRVTESRAGPRDRSVAAKRARNRAG